MSERRYTLEVAKRELEKRKCARDGHRWDEIRTPESNLPVALICSRCGQRLAVHGEEREMDA